ncbi:MAG: DUF4430 domain-containing protein [Clostridia bacterium]|nr:DUF4430 domain-containing protein [Clostridia bacterium]
MKKTLLCLFLALVCILSCFSLIACKDETADPTETDLLWTDATYKEDKTFGNGSKTVQVEVKAGDRSVTFTLKTDKTTLADALLEHQLVSGEDGAYGLYIKTVNGILADYDVDQTYWQLTKNGVDPMTGASGVTVADGEHYELTRKK